MGLDALGIWVLISVNAPGEIIAISETEDACMTTRAIYLEGLDPDYNPDGYGPYGRGINPEISKLAQCVFMPNAALTLPQDL